jgi:hypothetical protein
MEKELINKKEGKIFFNSKVISLFIIVLIVFILYIAGPANAFFSKLIVPNEYKIVSKGETIRLNAVINPEEDNINDVTFLKFTLRGPSVAQRNYECNFYLNGTIVISSDTCKGINISLTPANLDYYGYNKCSVYGYGYETNCLLNYSIEIDSGKYFAGEYDSILKIFTRTSMHETNSEKIIITINNRNDFKRCSVRAYDGSLILVNKNFTNNKLSFYITTDLENDLIRGGGSITGQKGRERFSYKFDIADVIENDKNHAVLYISGKYRIGIKGGEKENAILYFDKINNKISMVGEKIYIKTMYITFRKDCE